MKISNIFESGISIPFSEPVIIREKRVLYHQQKLFTTGSGRVTEAVPWAEIKTKQLDEISSSCFKIWSWRDSRSWRLTTSALR